MANPRKYHMTMEKKLPPINIFQSLMAAVSRAIAVVENIFISISSGKVLMVMYLANCLNICRECSPQIKKLMIY